MNKPAVIVLLLLVVLCKPLHGQQKTGYLEGTLNTRVAGTHGLQSGRGTDGAVIQLAIARDTLYTMAYNGKFYFDKIPTGKGNLTVTHLNYDTATKEVEVSARTLVDITLTEKEHTLNEAQVTARVPLITMVGDTLRINAAAVKLMEGDLALEILKQVPGVEISESGIKVLGRDVARTYVNKRMIFGSNKMTALINLPASEVISIDSYEEYAIADSTLRRAEDKKQQVLNIRTKTPIVSAVSCHALASFGHDMDWDGRERYGIGATGNFFSESLLMSVNAYSNDINRRSNRMTDLVSTNVTGSGYIRQDYVHLDAEKNWGTNRSSDIVCLSAGYTYNHNNTQSGSTRQYLYLPTSEYSIREYADTSSSEGTNALHNARLGFRMIKQSFGMFSYDGSFQKLNNVSDIGCHNSNILDVDEVAGIMQHHTQENGYRLTQSIRMTKPISKGLHGDFNAKYGYGDTNGEGYRLDSLSSTGLKKIIESGPIGRSTALEIGGKLIYPLIRTQLGSLGLGYRFSSESSFRKRFATDMTDIVIPLVDSVNTYNYTTNYHTHNGSLNANLRLWGGAMNVQPSLSFQSGATNRSEHFPEEQAYDRRQNALLPSLSLSRFKTFTRLTISYMTNTELPSIEQWRGQLNNQNPYFLMAGNPELKQSYIHQFSGSYVRTGKNGKNLNISINLAATKHKISERTRYFTQDTPLPEWNYYIAPAQSSLTTYENLDGMITGSMEAGYGQVIPSIQCKLDIASEFRYASIPSYLQNELNTNQGYTPSLRLTLSSNFSRSFRFTLNTRSAYSYYTNTIRPSSKLLNCSGRLTTESRFLKYFVFNTYYDMQYYRRLTDQRTNTVHVLNAVLGVKLLKGNMEMSLAAFDLLNAGTRFNTVVRTDYILNSWSESSGRYFTINVGYKFYQSKSGLKQPKTMSLKDGRTL